MQKDEQVKKAQQLQHDIDQMWQESDALLKEVKDLSDQKVSIEAEMTAVQQRLSVIQGELPGKQHELRQLAEQEEKHEARYMILLEAMPSLVQVMKK
eukprot:CAMPEP_0197886702 /NCGR_PEP_ID=MMETSP1439-20131203/17341_1 /TAXON_ID=66791 /ORGANISM="Gonyaulax spinifera, Strain CCMP409" /LENGTH=96 /DNA_ID=CAMNT_0043506511 /DNA_START=67 /DNA_END=357 /DNA_ORIENTATION=-